MKTTNVALVGASGYWGRKILPNLLDCPGVHLRALLSHRTPPEELRPLLPSAEGIVTRDLDEMVGCPDIDAFVIATPTSTHYAVAMKAISAGKHVFLEKPPAFSREEARALAAAASRTGSIVVVDHIYLFSKHIMRMANIIRQGAIGKPLHFLSLRSNFGLFRSDSDSISDLAYHDIYVIRHFFDAYRPLSVNASSTCAFRRSFAETCSFSVRFAGGLVADVFLSWLTPGKERKMVVAGTGGIIEFRDDCELVMHAKSIDWTGKGYTTADRGSRSITVAKDNNPLRDALRHFFRCVKRGEDSPLCNLSEGAETMRWQERIRQSAREGRRVKV